MIRVMRKIALGAVIGCAVLGFAGSAQAVVLVTPQGQPVGGKWQRWADKMRVPSVDRVAFAFGGETYCVTACFYSDPPLSVWVSPRDDNARWDLYHELGHAYDWTHLTDHDRFRLEGLMGDRGEHWDEQVLENPDPRGGASDDFAQMYALCAKYFRPGWPNQWSWWVTRASSGRAVRSICRLIASVRHQAGDPGAFATGAVP